MANAAAWVAALCCQPVASVFRLVPSARSLIARTVIVW
jgi:hypothetical protein